MNLDLRSERIRTLNDDLRQHRRGGHVVITAGLAALPGDPQQRILQAVTAFDAFEDGNDPYAEHDFGALTVEDVSVYFKIDYYDTELTDRSPDSSDPAVTCRVLTVMLADKW